MTELRGPTEEQRTIIIGRTGSGKTVFAVNLLSSRNFHEQPWVIIDYKGDPLVAQIREDNPGKIKEIFPRDKPPTKPGIYYMRPAPILDDEAMEAWLMRVWQQGKVGLYIDEGYALPNTGAAFTLILTQGRSLKIPVIALYQRPVWMNKFAVAQADFFAIFEQNIKGDKKTTADYIQSAFAPDGAEISVYSRLPRFHCLWYDVSGGRTTVLRPAPNGDAIRQTFRKRLRSRTTGNFI